MRGEVEVVERIRAIVREAMAERRGLVAYTRLEAAELDRLARKTELEALERVAALLPAVVVRPELEAVRAAIEGMRRALADLDAMVGIREASRSLARDEVIWETFERVAALLGLLDGPR
jgi:hypothetical protein